MKVGNLDEKLRIKQQNNLIKYNMNMNETNLEKNNLVINVPSAKELKAILDAHIVGQDETKKILSIAVHNHYRRIQQLLGQIPEQINSKYKDIEVEKSNVLCIGPTGTGKTLLAKTLAKIIGVPLLLQMQLH